MECSDEDIYTIARYGLNWITVGRRLIGDQKVTDIGRDCHSEEEKRDKMLLEWKKTKSHDATFQNLVKVLRELDNNATADRVEELMKKKSRPQGTDFIDGLHEPSKPLPKDSKILYANAMKTGLVKRTVVKCLIVGAAGVGKTSIKRLLLEEKLPEKRVSTGVLENPDVAVSISRDVSISRGIMNGDSWHVVRNEKDLMNIIAEIMKAQAKSEATPKEKPQEKPPSTSTASESVEPMGTEERQEDSVVLNDFIRAIIEAKGGKEFLNTTWIHFIDSGGQPEFHDLLPVFVPNTSVVLFVFKLSEGLDERPIVQYYGPNGPIGDPFKSYLTHKEILEHCLKVCHAQGESCQTIMLIGTHKDCPEQKLKQNDVEECLKPVTNKAVLFPNKQFIASLNCLSNTNEDMNIVKEIREELLKAIKNVGSEETPMAWFGLELALKKASQSEKSKHKGILSLEQCQVEANQFEYFRENSGQFDAAMEHLVKYNIILRYSQVLPDVVFCDPQVLLTMVTEIVQHHYKMKNSLIAVKGESQNKFRDNAFITAEILNCISSQYSDKKGLFSSEQFFELLSYLKIISAIKSDEYLMPALLPNADDPAAMVGEIDGMKRLPPLCISFEGGCAPSGVFCSLVATVLQSGKWELCMNNEIPRCLFRNCVTFKYERHTIITLLDLFSHFSIYMYIPTYMCVNACPSTTRNEVHEYIHTIAKNLQYPNLKFQDAIKCPKHLQENHLALWLQDVHVYECTRDGTCGELIPEDCKIWIQKTAGSSSGAATGDMKSDRRACEGVNDDFTDVSVDQLGEDDLMDVIEEVSAMTAKWKSLGLALRLKPAELDTISSTNHTDPTDCLRDMLLTWLRQCYDFKRFGPPSWRMLCQAISKPAGGKSPALAKKIAEHHH